MNKALVILGPTASGKTALALSLALHEKIEIISLDSALVYRGMDIGTAKPTKEELKTVPHHLIDVCEPHENYSAASFREDCIRLVDEICKRGALPVICGGTMMYYKSLVEGLSPLPKTDETVREYVSKQALTYGWPYMHEKLRDIDPQSYVRLDPHDKQRISRALEIFEMTGKPMSSFFAQKKDQCPFERLEFVLLPKDDDRSHLREIIRTRFIKMLDHGLVSEVKHLIAQHKLTLDNPSMRCVGYRQVFEYLEGVYSYETMIEKSVIATAQLAKHQMTWLRGGLAKDTGYLKKIRLDIGNEHNLETVLKVLSENRP